MLWKCHPGPGCCDVLPCSPYRTEGLIFPRCQERPPDVKPSSRTALAEEFLCLMSLSLPKGSGLTMMGQWKAISPLSSQQGAHPPWEHLRGSVRPAFWSYSLPFLSTGVDPENNPPTNLLKVTLCLRDCSLGIHLAQTSILAEGPCIYFLLAFCFFV